MELWQLHHDTTRIIIGQAYTPEQVRRWAPDAMEPWWNDRMAQSNPFVAEQDGKIVGFAELETDGHIDRFYCHHQWQRRGVGRKLYQAIEDEASRLGIRLLFAEVSVTARKFFESMGFEVTVEQNNIVCGAVARNFRMQKRLDSGPDVREPTPLSGGR